MPISPYLPGGAMIKRVKKRSPLKLRKKKKIVKFAENFLPDCKI